MSKRGREATPNCIDTDWCRRRDCMRCNDRDLEWSPAWLADRMARSDLVLRRVQDTEGCCGGMRCMHYVRVARVKVRGKGAAKPMGVATDLVDGAMYFRNKLGL